MLSSCSGLENRGSGNVFRSDMGVLSRDRAAGSGGGPFLRFWLDVDLNNDLVLLKKRWGVVEAEGSGGLDGGVVTVPSVWPGDAMTRLHDWRISRANHEVDTSLVLTLPA